jgi:hypothetical protein
MRFKDFIFQETVFKTTLYHGTRINNLPNILNKGLLMATPLWTTGTAINSGVKAVYLTPDIELAARYAVGQNKDQIPAVLELDISQAKRLAKLAYDPMDREEDAWEQEDGGYGHDDVYSLKHDIEEFIKPFIPHYWGR